MTEKINPGGTAEGGKQGGLPGRTEFPLTRKMIGEMAREIAKEPWLGWDEIQPTEKDIEEVRRLLKEAGLKVQPGTELPGADLGPAINGTEGQGKDK